MPNELPPDHLKSVWQSQNVEPVQMSLEELRQKAEQFQKRIRQRNLREYLAGAVVVAAFSYFFWKMPPLRVGSGLVLAGTAYVMYRLYTSGGANTVPESLALDTCLAFHRRELERQRDLLRSVWKWYLLPLVPGMLTILMTRLVNLPARKWLAALPFGMISVVFFYAVWKLNQRAADKLEAQIVELKSMSGNSL